MLVCMWLLNKIDSFIRKCQIFISHPFSGTSFEQIGGGSLRIYRREIQQKVLEIIGISLEKVSGCVSVFSQREIIIAIRMKHRHRVILFQPVTWVSATPTYEMHIVTA